jgi:hypothetical protein
MSVNPFTFSLQPVVDVEVYVAQAAAPRQAFNQGLVVGTSSVIPSCGGTNNRIRRYTSPAGLLTDLFALTDPEYLAALAYFAQAPAPTYLWVGRQDLTSLKTVIPSATAKGSGYSVNDVITVVLAGASLGTVRVATVGTNGTGIATAQVHTDAKGTGYSQGDVLTVTQAGAVGGTLTVETIGAGGSVETVSVLTAGDGYSVEAELATTVAPAGGTGAKVDILTLDTSGSVETVVVVTGGTGYSVDTDLVATGGTGVGLTVDITAVGETPLIALAACRLVNWDWYSCIALAAVEADHLAIAAWAETETPRVVYFINTQDADIINGVDDNLADQLKALLYSRTFVMYCGSSLYAAASVMGRAMGLNTGLANSAYTLKFKNLVGIDTEDVTVTQQAAAEGYSANLYLSYANYYSWLEQGVMASGTFFDQVINRDMLANNIQLTVADLLNQSVKIPQTDDGMTAIALKMMQACDEAVTLGYLAPGNWRGLPILNLDTGDTLPKGYLIQAPACADQSDADRSLRKSVPFYISVIEAGAVHSCLIGVYIDI